MSRLVTLPVGQRTAKRVNDPKVFKSANAEALREKPCACCGERPGEQLHHVVPRSQRGDDVLENLIGLCSMCHTAVHNQPMGGWAWLQIGRRLSPENIAYVIGKKAPNWLERRYGVTA